MVEVGTLGCWNLRAEAEMVEVGECIVEDGKL